MLTAVIFDMDGVIVDTEGLQSKSFEHVLSKHKVTPVYNEHGIVQEVGVNARDNWHRLKQLHKLEPDIESLYEQKQAAYERLLSAEIKPMPGLLPLFELLKENEIKTAIASSSSLRHIELILNQLSLFDQFDIVVSGDQVKNGKPAPDIFLAAAQKLKVGINECVVIEDAPTGVKAANNASIKVIAVPNEFTKKHSFDHADLIVPSLESLSLEILQNLVV